MSLPLPNFVSNFLRAQHFELYDTYWCICQVSNLIYVDQPIGTGFSYTSDEDDIRHDEEGVSNDLYDFLQVCFSHVHFQNMKILVHISHFPNISYMQQ